MVQTIENHLYTTSTAERDEAVCNLGYVYEGIVGWGSAQQDETTIPLFRLYHAGICDHFYTTSVTERDHAVRALGYADEGIACLVFTDDDRVPRIQPLYRLYSDRRTDHFYTMSRDEHDMAVAELGYRSEGVACYLYPFAASAGVPLYRLYIGDAESPHAEPVPAVACT